MRWNELEIFKVALLQLDHVSSLEASKEKGISACRKAKQLGAHIAVFPEMWNTGYDMLFDGRFLDVSELSYEKVNQWLNMAIDLKSDYIQAYQKLAQELEMAIVLTFLEKRIGLPQNTAIIIDRFGKIIHKYSKVHTVDFKMEAFMKSGNDFPVSELEYQKDKKVKLGTMICFDRDFPESARALMLNGAEIILVPNACDMTPIRLDTLKVRAYENMIGVVTVNYANNGGKSSAFSPIVRDENRNFLESTLLVLNEEEDIQVVSFDLEELRSYRQRETLGNAYRKPSSYHELVNTEIFSPFIRKDARRS